MVLDTAETGLSGKVGSANRGGHNVKNGGGRSVLDVKTESGGGRGDVVSADLMAKDRDRNVGHTVRALGAKLVEEALA